MSIPMMMCPWAFGGCDRSRRWGRRWCGRGLFCVLWSSCALYSPLAPLVSSKSPPPSRWAVGQRLSARYPPVFFWLKKAGSAQGRPKILPTYLGGMLPSDKNFGSWSMSIKRVAFLRLMFVGRRYEKSCATDRGWWRPSAWPRRLPPSRGGWRSRCSCVVDRHHDRRGEAG